MYSTYFGTDYRKFHLFDLCRCMQCFITLFPSGFLNGETGFLPLGDHIELNTPIFDTFQSKTRGSTHVLCQWSPPNPSFQIKNDPCIFMVRIWPILVLNNLLFHLSGLNAYQLYLVYYFEKRAISTHYDGIKITIFVVLMPTTMDYFR